MAYANMYRIIMSNREGKEEESVVILIPREYAKMQKRVNEVVYIDENKIEWSLKKIWKV